MKHLNAVKSTVPDLSAKVIAITGTTSGTGFAVAQAVAEKGAKVILLNRPSERSTASLEKLRNAVPTAEFIAVDCDLMEFDSVRGAVDVVKDKVESLYGLCCNAGIMGLPNKATKDGYDVQMQTNHLSHFLLIKELFPLLVNGAEAYGDARVVTHSSMARHFVPGKNLEEKYLGKNGPELGDDGMNLMSFSGPCFVRYHHSKLANSVFTQALHRRISQSANPAVQNIRSVSAHPGISRTNLFGSHIGGWFSRNIGMPLLSLVGNSSEDAAAGILLGTAGPAESGALYGPKGNSMTGAAVAAVLESHETDVESGDMLWRASQAATGVTFAI